MKAVLFAIFSLVSSTVFADSYYMAPAQKESSNLSRVLRTSEVIVDFNWSGETNDSLQFVCAPGKPMSVSHRLNKPATNTRYLGSGDSVVLVMAEDGVIPEVMVGARGGKPGERWAMIVDATDDASELAAVIRTSKPSDGTDGIKMAWAVIKYAQDGKRKIVALSPALKYSQLEDMYYQTKSLNERLKACNNNAGSPVYKAII